MQFGCIFSCDKHLKKCFRPFVRPSIHNAFLEYAFLDQSRQEGSRGPSGVKSDRVESGGGQMWSSGFMCGQERPKGV